MKALRLLNKKFFVLLLMVMAIVSTCPPVAIAAGDEGRYLILDPVSGTNPELKLYINKKSLDLDLAKTQNIRVRLKINDLYSTVDAASSFKVNLYELLGNGDKKFVSSQNLTVSRKHIGNRILSIGVGYFVTPEKQLLFEVYDTAGNLINSYETVVNAYNLGSQVLGGEGINTDTADCGESEFSDCQLDYLFQRISFEAKPQRQISTRIVKGEDGLYKVTIPVPRANFKPLSRKVRRRGSSGNGDGNGGGTTVSFGDTISATNIQVGTSAADYGTIGYDPAGDQIVINENTFFGQDGKVGIGVEDPQGWLHVRNGDSTTPSIVINPGILTTSPVDGAIEYDGDKLYFTSDGVRAELGARGPAGPSGNQGPIGPQGPKGDSIAILKNGGTLNGALVFGEGFLENAVLNGETQILGDVYASGIVNAAQFNGDLFNGGVFKGHFIGNGRELTGISSALANGTISNLTIDNGTINNISINNTSVSNTIFNGDANILDGKLTFTTNGYLENVVLNGQTVLDGTLNILTGSIINGDLNFTNGTINGATFINSTFTNPQISKLVAPDGSPDPALSVDNNGHVGILGAPKDIYDMWVNGASQVYIQSENASENTLDIRNRSTFTSNGSYYNYAATINSLPIVSSGITNTGTAMGADVTILRNSNAIASDDNGLLANVVGVRSSYGTYDSLPGESPMITNAYGFYAYPYAKTGSITNSYGFYLGNKTGSAPITNYYGIYQVDGTAKNYFAGNVGLDTLNPQGTLDVNGTIYTDNLVINPGGTINGASLINSNVSKLVAPDGSPDPALSVDNNGAISIGFESLNEWEPARFSVNGDSAYRHTLELRDNAVPNSFKRMLWAYPSFNITSNGTHYSRVINPDTRQATVGAGVRDNGYRIASWNQTLRSQLLDQGSLASTTAYHAAYGHWSTLPATAHTDNIYGIFLDPYIQNGSIDSMYDIYIDEISGSAPVTNRYAIYQVGASAKNYFAGNTGLDTQNPQGTLDVNGTIYADKIVINPGGTINGATLINSNVSKLVAPDGSPDPAFSVTNNGTLVFNPYSGTILRNVNGDTGATTEGFRIGFHPGTVYGLGSATNDFLIFDKTDINDNDPDGGIAFVNTGNDGIAEMAMMIRGVGGNVGIGPGMTLPSEKLQVNGNILANNIRLKSGGTINGATLINSNISKLVAPDGSPNPALRIDNNGYAHLGELPSITRARVLAVNGDVYANQRVNDSNGVLFSGMVYGKVNSSSTKVLYAQQIESRPTVAPGITNAGQAMGSFANALRNYDAAVTNDNGTLSYLSGIRTHFGHYETSTTASPVTTNAYGFVAVPYVLRGSITNLYGSLIASKVGNGSVSNYYGLYQQDANAKNYFNGNVGIAVTNPSAKLQVNGTILANSIRLQSSGTINGATLINSNISKLVAPDGSPNPALSVTNNGTLALPNQVFGTFLKNISTENGFASDGFRMVYGRATDYNLGSNPNGDYLIFEKTDGNNADPDGGIAFVNRGSSATVVPSMVIQGTGNVGIGGLTSPAAKLDINGTVAFKTTNTTTNITAGGGITASKTIMLIQGSGGAVDISANPQIAAGTDGQILTLIGMSDINTVKIDDGTGVNISTASYTMGLEDSLTLIYVTALSKWIELSRSDN